MLVTDKFSRGIFETLERGTTQWLFHSYQRYTLRGAVTRAYCSFAQRYPMWVEDFFDNHFVMTHVLPLLQKSISRGETVTPEQITQQWSKQLSVSPDLRQRQVAQLMPIATRFLALVADELAEAQLGRDALALIQGAVD